MKDTKEVKELQSGVLLNKHPCPECGSNDNLLVYVKHDEEGNEYLPSKTPLCNSLTSFVSFISLLTTFS